MPNHSSLKNRNQHKPILLAFALLFSSFFIHAQSLTGLWIGSVSNDSASIRKDQSFEIALTEYKGKVYGYSRNEFIVNDTLYYIVKRVKGEIEGDVCEVTDEKIIAYNFKGKLDKNVKVISTFRRNLKDSTWYLDGTWKTKATKNYYSVSGKVALGEEKDLTASKIFPHLEELNLANDVAFYKERKQDAVAMIKIATPERLISSLQDNKEIPNPETGGIVPAKPDVKLAVADLPRSTEKTEPVTADLLKIETKTEVATTSINPSVKEKTDSVIAKADVQPTQTDKVINEPAIAKTSTEPQKEKTEPVVAKNNQQQIVTVVEKIKSDQKVTDKTITEQVIAKTTTDPQKEKTEPVVAKNNQQQNVSVTENIKTDQKATDKTNTEPAITKTTIEPQKEKTEPAVAKNNQQQNVVVPESIKADQKATDKTLTEPAIAKTSTRPQKEKTEPVAVSNNQQPKISAAEMVKMNAAQKKDIAMSPASSEVIIGTANPADARVAEQTKKPVTPEEASRIAINQTATEKPKVKLTAADIKTKTIDIGGRKSEFSQAVLFTSDSLEIALYDNGEIDGDTVSVYMNGQVIVSHQGLKSTAIKKTIQVPAGIDEFTLVMYAESLGKLPPNTGLLVIRDGDDVYNLRFSSDFQKSSGIVLKRNR